MRSRFAACSALFLLVSIAGAEQPAAPSALVDRVGNTGFVQLHADSFKALDAKQQALAYWLMQASIAIDPIFYDQLSFYGLRQKRLLDEIVAHLDPARRAALYDALSNLGAQVWMTGADPAAFGDIVGRAQVFEVHTGTIAPRL